MLTKITETCLRANIQNIPLLWWEERIENSIIPGKLICGNAP